MCGLPPPAGWSLQKRDFPLMTDSDNWGSKPLLQVLKQRSTWRDKVIFLFGQSTCSK